MKKYIYWGIGIAAVAGLGYWLYKKNKEKTSSAEGNCPKPLYGPPSTPSNCSSWYWNTKYCRWVCQSFDLREVNVSADGSCKK